MGTYLIALMEYAGLTERVAAVLDRLENYPTREALGAFGIDLPDDLYSPQTDHAEWDWTSREVLPNTHPVRPALPDMSVALIMPEPWSLNFGSDTIRADFNHRWGMFLSDVEQQQWVIGYIRAICRAFEATDCIFASTYHDVDDGFWKGLPYNEILKAGVAVELDEVSDISTTLALAPDGQIKALPEGTPLPSGWSRAKEISPVKYWRMPLQEKGS
jgi:hypothetical protein